MVVGATVLLLVISAGCGAPSGPREARAATTGTHDSSVSLAIDGPPDAVAGPPPSEAAAPPEGAPALASPDPTEAPTPPLETTPVPAASPTPAAPTAVAALAASRNAPTVLPAAPGTPSQVVSRGRADRRAVTLTFDAGADRGHAERILNELARQRVQAAFGITGKWAEANRDLVTRVHREGHTLINHSYDHSSFTGFSWSVVARTPAERASQLARTERLLSEIAGASAHPYFRPPFGDLDPGVLADVGAAGYGLTVMWTVDSMGWRGWDAARITQRCLEGAAPGAIYIFHVGAASSDADALPAVIDGLRARGFEIASLADVIGTVP